MITIITSTLNALPLLQSTFNSISSQKPSDWQWIVVDGASQDGTADWLYEVVSQCSNVSFISESDKGIYDAWNKALPLIKGDWVVFLGAGDKFKSSNTLSDISMKLSEIPTSVNLAYGRVEVVDCPESIAGVLRDSRWEGVDGRWGYGRPVIPGHQSIFHRTPFLLTSQFDASFRIAGDTALILPELIRNGAYDIHFVTTLMLQGGVSDNMRNREVMLREILRINRASGLLFKRPIYQLFAYLFHSTKGMVWQFLHNRKSKSSHG